MLVFHVIIVTAAMLVLVLAGVLLVDTDEIPAAGDGPGQLLRRPSRSRRCRGGPGTRPGNARRDDDGGGQLAR